MANAWTPAPEVAKVARRVIALHDGEDGRPGTLRHLVNTPVYYVFCADQETVRGAKAWGTARKIPARELYWVANYALANPDVEEATTGDTSETYRGAFLVTIHRDTWDRMKDIQRRALVHHELLHCSVEETEDGPSLVLVPHDLEEFREIVATYGYWRDGIEDFARAAQAGQASLFDQAADDLQEQMASHGMTATIRVGDGPEVPADREGLRKVAEQIGSGLAEKLAEGDEVLGQACMLACGKGYVSTGILQRGLGVGFGRAKAILDAMELAEVAKANGLGPHKVELKDPEEARKRIYAVLDQRGEAA